MTKHIPSNYSIVELIRYTDLPPIIEDKFIEFQSELEDTKEELTIADRRIEILEEQLYFAREVLSEIIKVAEESTKCKEIKYGITMAIENGYFEL